jgi:molybdopterin-guanine dinucleotide biosynthesis protein A
MEPHPDIYGLILSGGRSTRMGTDKGTIVYHEMPQREFLFNILKKYCKKVFTSCHSEQNIPQELNPLEDQFEIKGPMNGILSAFKKFPEKAWLIVAVDMPYADEVVFEQLMTNRNRKKVATCFYNEAEEFPEPLLTLWERKAFPLLLEFFLRGRVSPKDFLAENDVQLVIPQDPKILISINDKEEYLKFKKPE